MDEQERELNGSPGQVLGGEASTAFGGGSGLGAVGTDASSEDLTGREQAAELAGGDQESASGDTNP